jgi:hypothetical protein
VRGFGSFGTKLHRPNPLNLSFLPSGEKGRSVRAVTPPHRTKNTIWGRHVGPYSRQMLTRSLAIFG